MKYKVIELRDGRERCATTVDGLTAARDKIVERSGNLTRMKAGGGVRFRIAEAGTGKVIEKYEL